MPRLPIGPDLLPVRRAAELLLGPAALVRHGSVAIARTTRHWELNLGRLAGRELHDDSAGSSTSDVGDDPASAPHADRAGSQAPRRPSRTLQSSDGRDDSSDGTGAPGPADSGVDLRDLMRPVPVGDAGADAPDASDLPVEGWAELSPPAAGAALADLGADDLDLLLAYERAHGRRPAYLLMLQRRRETVSS